MSLNRSTGEAAKLAPATKQDKQDTTDPALTLVAFSVPFTTDDGELHEPDSVAALPNAEASRLCYSGYARLAEMPSERG